jgi:hypothetical protein
MGQRQQVHHLTRNSLSLGHTPRLTNIPNRRTQVSKDFLISSSRPFLGLAGGVILSQSLKRGRFLDKLIHDARNIEHKKGRFIFD